MNVLLSPEYMKLIYLAFWPVYLASLTFGGFMALRRRDCLLARVILSLALGSLAMTALVEWTGESLAWWQHIAIDSAVLYSVTRPPSSWWQATVGAMVGSQIALRCILAMAPGIEKEIWLSAMMVGFAKCLLVVLWGGGRHVESYLSAFSSWASGVVMAAGFRGHAA